MAKKTEAEVQSATEVKQKNIRPKCGIVMPISAMGGIYSEQHWRDILEILKSALDEIGYDSDVVSFAEDAGVIHKTIVQNLYTNEMIVCDISGKNPNVMLELGLRLAFQKPTIIIKDTSTSAPFDVSSMEYIQYPGDLHYPSIVTFKEVLKKKVIATHMAWHDNTYSSILDSFGKFKVAEIHDKELPAVQELLPVMMARLDEMNSEIKGLKTRVLSAPTNVEFKNPITVKSDYSPNIGEGIVFNSPSASLAPFQGIARAVSGNPNYLVNEALGTAFKGTQELINGAVAGLKLDEKISTAATAAAKTIFEQNKLLINGFRSDLLAATHAMSQINPKEVKSAAATLAEEIKKAKSPPKSDDKKK